MTVSCYIAGPMRGYERYNFPAFDECAEYMRQLGHDVRNPAEHDRDGGFDEYGPLDGFDLQGAMRWDLAQVLNVERIILLPGWRASAGVGIEMTVARAVGVPASEYDPYAPVGLRLSDLGTDAPAETITAEADRIVDGARQHDYGHPIVDFTRTGRMWGAILGLPDIDPRLVGLCMVAAKVSREVNRPKRDNRVDIAGYAKTVDLVSQAQGAA